MFEIKTTRLHLLLAAMAIALSCVVAASSGTPGAGASCRPSSVFLA